MKCILISLSSRSAMALFESPARVLALVSAGVLSHPIFTEPSKLNSTSFMKFSLSSSRVVAVIFMAATHSSISFSIFRKSITSRFSTAHMDARAGALFLPKVYFQVLFWDFSLDFLEF
ncbi:UNVERIFIED_CONTAM: hypothetical protein Sradi_6464200 [Sesamum radiatum]|uniref:Secreted protein n=1 Tax=Sesamum radiatum TaxID=300843 RepID=A0AAW2K4T5_SESRA